MWDMIVSVPDHCLSFYFGAGVFVSSSRWKLIVAGVGAGAVSIVGGAVSRGGGCGLVGCLRVFLLFLAGFSKQPGSVSWLSGRLSWSVSSTLTWLSPSASPYSFFPSNSKPKWYVGMFDLKQLLEITM